MRAAICLQLAARDPVRLEAEADDIRVRAGVTVTGHPCDVLRDDAGVSLADTLDPCPDVAVCVVGLLCDQRESEGDLAAAVRVMWTNYIGPALLMGALAGRFDACSSGCGCDAHRYRAYRAWRVRSRPRS